VLEIVKREAVGTSLCNCANQLGVFGHGFVMEVPDEGPLFYPPADGYRCTLYICLSLSVEVAGKCSGEGSWLFTRLGLQLP
jgi:hypothetical protein